MESLAKHFRTLTAQAFTRYGFAYADLLTQWQAIIGEDLAAICAPERIKWPRNSTEKQGGTLVLRAMPGRALDVQHETARIAERINCFYGYGAIAAVRIIQAPLKPKQAAPVKPSLDQAGLEVLESRLQDIADPALKAALKKLGTGALASRSSGER